ncbi:relaxase/mobilization nuclease domain-containing protein [Megasphaera stantonii]|uniref:relaxase/mobilization nuclease domain-containing protein n=1 Tax=Megasphaera stantonii TaxID=2144175 RepID=UPI00320A8740
MAILKALSSKRSPVAIQKYVLQEKKTSPDLVKGYEVDGMEFGRQFERIQSLFEKTSGRRYYHYILSLTPEETGTVPPEKATALGYQLAEQTFGKQGYQFAVITHTDTTHVHDHIIVNAVNFNTGRKLHMTSRDLQAMKEQLNLLCRSHGLEAIPDSGKKIADGEYWTKRRGVDPWKQELRDVIDLVRSQTTTYRDFKQTLQEDWGIAIQRDTGKGITYVHPNGKKVRGKKLGEAYDKPSLMATFAPEQQQAMHPHRKKVIARHYRSPRFPIGRRHSASTSRTGGLIHSLTNTPEGTYQLHPEEDEDTSKDKAMQRERELYQGWEL